MLPDHYATLGVDDHAPHAVIRAAYRRAIRGVHPDIAGSDQASTSRAVAVNTAWSVLRDPQTRAGYDRQRVAANAPVAARATTAPAGTPSWSRGGVRPVSVEQLREAAARESAYSEVGRQQRQAFSAASMRLGVSILLVGMLLLAMVVAR